MSDLAERIESEHELSTQSGTWEGLVYQKAACSCGTPLSWPTRETEHKAHRYDEFEQAVRAQVVADILAFSTDHLVEHAARIAEGSVD